MGGSRAIATITEYQCHRFIWQNIICQFGLPKQLVTDDCRQFDNQAFAVFNVQHGIRQIKASVTFPQSNRQIENFNRTLLDGLRKRLEEASGTWVKQLVNVLWAYKITPRRATAETPFSFAFGFEAKVPIEVQVPHQRIILYNDKGNEEVHNCTISKSLQ